MIRRSMLLLAILPLIAALVSGCPFAPGKKPPVEKPSLFLPQTSAANCLANLRQAYVERDIDEYSKLFTTDFTFVFDPADVANPNNPTPTQWGHDDELEATTKMFASEVVDKIELTFKDDSAVPSDDEFPSTWKVEMTEINLGLDTRDPNGAPLRQLVQSGHCTFYFKEAAGKWSIFRWVDKGIANPPAKSIPAKVPAV